MAGSRDHDTRAEADLSALVAGGDVREILAGQGRARLVEAAFELIQSRLADTELRAEVGFTLTDLRTAEHWQLTVLGAQSLARRASGVDQLEVTFHLRAEQLVTLALARVGGEEMISRGLVGVGGDVSLGRKVARAIAVDSRAVPTLTESPRLVRPLREATLLGASAVINVLIMFLASLGMWLGVPVLWLFLGSQIQAASGSLAIAVAVMAVGAGISVAGLISLLHWLGLRQHAMRRARGLETSGDGLMELVVTVSAVVAISAFAIWFLFFAGGGAAPPTVGG